MNLNSLFLCFTPSYNVPIGKFQTFMKPFSKSHLCKFYTYEDDNFDIISAKRKFKFKLDD